MHLKIFFFLLEKELFGWLLTSLYICLIVLKQGHQNAQFSLFYSYKQAEIWINSLDYFCKAFFIFLESCLYFSHKS